VRGDRIDKLGDYARAGIRYYCILDPRLRSLEVFELGRNGRYSVALNAAAGRPRIPGCPGLRLDLDGLWAAIDRAEREEKRGPGSDRASGSFAPPPILAFPRKGGRNPIGVESYPNLDGAIYAQSRRVTNDDQPVWWLAPRPLPLSPWKYS
jgi:hypothetical protein